MLTKKNISDFLRVKEQFSRRYGKVNFVQHILHRKHSRVKKMGLSTVKTMMDRMVKKGLLKTEKIRNLYLYSSAVTQSRKSEITRTLKRLSMGHSQ